jgi:hypothetical protein
MKWLAAVNLESRHFYSAILLGSSGYLPSTAHAELGVLFVDRFSKIGGCIQTSSSGRQQIGEITRMCWVFTPKSIDHLGDADSRASDFTLDVCQASSAGDPSLSISRLTGGGYVSRDWA